jgi:tetratricopeptide (TPR) repeat protein
VALLALFDLLEEQTERFGFNDLVVSREIGRLRREGAALAEIIAAGLRVQREGGERLSRVRLVRLPEGELALRVGAYVAETSGQLRLPLADAGNPSLDQLFSAAETAEEDGDAAGAERLYRRILTLAPRDPTVRFNLANVLRAGSRREEARRLLREAARLDAGFAEAWYNLAHLAEEDRDPAAATAFLERALDADANYADAIYNLARLWLRSGRPERAMPLYERYLALDPHSVWSRRAKRSLFLCRIRLMMKGESPP